MHDELKKRGVNNPIHDIVNDNVYVLDDKNNLILSTFYSLHYHDSLRTDTVKTFGELKLLKYRLKGDSDE